MHHLVAFYQSVDPAGVSVPIAAVQDPVLTTSGNDVRIPNGLNQLIGEAAVINDLTVAVQAQFVSPSLRSVINRDIEPIVNGKVFGSPPEDIMHGDSPVVLVPNESLNLYMESNPAAAAIHYGLAWLADGPLQPVKGPIYTIRATSSITLAAGTWVNGNLTFTQTLPAGTYQIVGWRARGTNLLAARLVFVGGTYRPGVPAVNAQADLDAPFTRYGGMGIFGQFDSTTPPTVDCLGDTDTAQTHFFDVVKVK